MRSTQLARALPRAGHQTSRGKDEMLRLRSAPRCAVTLALLASAREVYAQSPAPAAPPPSPAAPASSVTTPPTLKLHGEATYPPEALKTRLEATVKLELDVDEAG